MLIKEKGEEEMMIEEGNILEYAGNQGFNELINKEKALDVLDARIQRDFAGFVPPPKAPSPMLMELKKKVLSSLLNTLPMWPNSEKSLLRLLLIVSERSQT